MADTRLHVVTLAVRPDRRAELLRGERLPDRADVVLLALDGEQRSALDRARLNRLAAECQRARRERILLETRCARSRDRTRRSDRAPRSIRRRTPWSARPWRSRPRPGCRRAPCAAFTWRAMFHAHEGGELHEPRIDLPERARITQRDGRDQVLLEPSRSAWRWRARSPWSIDAAVDRPGHQGHRARLRVIALLRHDGRGRERRNTRLAHGKHRRAGSDDFEKLDEVVRCIRRNRSGRRTMARRARCASRVMVRRRARHAWS